MLRPLIVIAALPREIAGLVRGVPAEPSLLRAGVHLHEVRGAVIVAAGMGAARASLAFQHGVERLGAVDTTQTVIVSIGLAGGCEPGLSAGTIADVCEVVDVRTGERFAAERLLTGGEAVRLATSDTIASTSEKARLHASYRAAMVDMEAATIARLARAAGMRFAAVKGVSDAHDFELQSLSRFQSAHGHFRTGAFALHTALRPHRWGATMRLGRDSQRALTALTDAVRGLLR